MPRPPNSREGKHRSLTDKTSSNNPKSNRGGPYKRWVLGTIHYFERKRAERRARKQEENPQDKYSRRGSNATIVIAVFTVILGVVGMLQWDSLRRTDETTRVALIASQRAWLGPKTASIPSSPIAGQELPVTIEYLNTGREPAFDFKHGFAFPFAEAWSGRGPLPPTVQVRVDGFALGCKKWNPNAAGDVVFPASGSSNYQLTIPIQGAVIDDDVVSGKKTIFISGCFAYSSFTAERHSAFCFFYRSGVTRDMNLNICPGGAYAD